MFNLDKTKEFFKIVGLIYDGVNPPILESDEQEYDDEMENDFVI